MLCALTVRKLKPGTFEDFKTAFVPEENDPNLPEGWKRFYGVRSVADENEVITFGFFDGTLEELNAGQMEDSEYARRRAAADEFVESVGTSGIFEVVEERVLE